jgi:hypothetical protein
VSRNVAQHRIRLVLACSFEKIKSTDRPPGKLMWLLGLNFPKPVNVRQAVDRDNLRLMKRDGFAIP